MRLYNARSRLDKVITSVAAQPFVWGQHDCLIFVGKCVEAVTGINFYSNHIGKYDDKDSAYEYLKSLGYETITDFVASFFNIIHVSEAYVGDVVVISSIPSCGIILGERVGYLSFDGFVTVSRESVMSELAYRVD